MSVYLSVSLDDLVVRSISFPSIKTFVGNVAGSNGSSYHMTMSAFMPFLRMPLSSILKLLATFDVRAIIAPV